MEFLDDLEQDPVPQAQRERIRREMRQLSALSALRGCRIFLILALSVLTSLTTIGSNHMPVPMYALLCYFLVYLVLEEAMKKYKTPEFLLNSLRLTCRYSCQKHLTEQYSLLFAFLLLFAIQYSFLNTMRLDSALLTYSPAGIALLLLILRYPGALVHKRLLRRRLLEG